MRLCEVAADFDAQTGSFTVVLPRWGSGRITTNGDFEGRSRVIVFRGTGELARKIKDDYSTVYWPEDQEDPPVGCMRPVSLSRVSTP